MEYTEHYDNLEQRNTLCSTAYSKGFRMLFDNFDSDWKKRTEPHGILTFTDEPELQTELARDYGKEIDKIKEDIVKLKADNK